MLISFASTTGSNQSVCTHSVITRDGHCCFCKYAHTNFNMSNLKLVLYKLQSWQKFAKIQPVTLSWIYSSAHTF